MVDTPKNALTEEQIKKAVELLRHWRGSVELPKNEEWKLRVWELNNPAIVAATKTAREKE